MPSSSALGVYNGSSNNTKPHPAVNSRPSCSHSFGIDRFLADQEQRCPPELGKTQSPADAEKQMMSKLLAFEKQFASSPEVRDQATAEAEEIAAMCARLDAFDKQFNASDDHSHN